MSQNPFPTVQSYPPGWNDPPADIFSKKNDKADANIDWNFILTTLTQLQQECDDIVEKNASSQQKRMLDDARKKIGPLLAVLSRSPQDAGDDGQILTELSSAIGKKEHDGIQAVISKILTNQFSSNPSQYQWVNGIKQLVRIAYNGK